MRPFTLFGAKSSNVVKQLEEKVQIKIQEEINRQVPPLKVKLKLEGFSDSEIEDIIQQASEEQTKLSLAEFHRVFLMEKTLTSRK